MNSTPTPPPGENAPARETSPLAVSAPLATAASSGGLFHRLKHHKVLEWTLAYAALAYTLLHGAEMLSSALSWPHVLVRVFTLLLIAGVPIVATLAWYHGARGLKRVTGAELIIITLLGVLAGSLLWYFGAGGHVSAHRDGGRPAASTTQTVPERSIAVLPFADMSEKQDQAYLGDGLAEEIINVLTRIPDLKVIGRTSSFQFRGKADLRDIGQSLGVVYVLEGSVRRAGDRVRVTAQLIDTRDGTHRWSHIYEERPEDLLALQTDVATAVARTLQLTLTSYYGESSYSPPAAAYDLYLRALRDLDTGSPESMRSAARDFERVFESDPSFAPAAVGLALAYDSLSGLMDSGEASAKAKQAIERALQADPRNANAYAVRALIRIKFDWDWTGASADLDRAQELGGSPETSFPAAKLAAAMGRLDKAAEILETNMATDPLAIDPPYYLSTLIYPNLRRFDDSDTMLARLSRLDPDTNSIVAWTIGFNNVMRGRIDAAKTVVDQVSFASGRDTLLAFIYAAEGRNSDFEAAIQRAATAQPAWSFAIADAYAFHGDKQKAIEWLHRAADERSQFIWTVTTDPLFDKLKGDERFTAFLQRVNLAQ